MDDCPTLLNGPGCPRQAVTRAARLRQRDVYPTHVWTCFASLIPERWEPLWQMFQLSVPNRARQLLPTLHLLALAPSHSPHSSSALPTRVSFSTASRPLRELLLSAWPYSTAGLSRLSQVFKSLGRVILLAQPPSALMGASGLPSHSLWRRYSAARAWLTS